MVLKEIYRVIKRVLVFGWVFFIFIEVNTSGAAEEVHKIRIIVGFVFT